MDNYQTEFPESFLYHYTSQNGFMGILGMKKIWATNALYMNDSEEINQALSIFLDCCKRFSYSDADSDEKQFIKSLHENILLTCLFDKNPNIYICSFSEQPDLLSQWRGYCPEASGISIGFDFSIRLADIVNKQGFSLVKCKYSSSSDQIPLNLTKFFTYALNTFNKTPKHLMIKERIDSALQGLNKLLFKIAAGIKNPAFSEENEWRLISEPIPFTDPRVKFRSGKSMLIPYVEIDLVENENDYINIPGVWVGPTPNPEGSDYSITNFLKKSRAFAYSNQFPIVPNADPSEKIFKIETPVFRSKVPYRTW
jgi:hypothetical protein